MKVANNIILIIVLGLYLLLFYNYLLVATWSLYLFPIALLAWFMADIILAFTHFYLDYFRLDKELKLKELLDYPSRTSREYQTLKVKIMKQLNVQEKAAFEFKIHHLRPKALGKRTFINLVAEAIITLVFPLLIVVNIAVYFDMLHPLAMFYFLIMSIGMSLGQFAHANTHKDKKHFLMEFLQKTHVFLPTKLHVLHHQSYTQSFCVLNGWSNKIVNTVARYVLKKKWFKAENLEVQ